jgi:hypothetical protein
MDMKAVVGGMRSGRRGALAGLLAGAAALLDRGADTEAGKRRCRRCPNRTCCVCNSSTANPGCRFGPAVTATQDTEAICNMVCGGTSEWSVANYNFAAGVKTTACSTDHTQCIEVGCPLC